MRYLSAFGKRVRPFVLLCMWSLFSLNGCGGDVNDTLPEEEFEKIYGDIIYLGELHRDDTLALRTAYDSLLKAHNTDTTVLFATARELTRDPETLNEIYRNIVLRLERITAKDTTKSEVPQWQENQARHAEEPPR